MVQKGFPASVHCARQIGRRSRSPQVTAGNGGSPRLTTSRRRSTQTAAGKLRSPRSSVSCRKEQTYFDDHGVEIGRDGRDKNHLRSGRGRAGGSSQPDAATHTYRSEKVSRSALQSSKVLKMQQREGCDYEEGCRGTEGGICGGAGNWRKHETLGQMSYFAKHPARGKRKKLGIEARYAAGIRYT